MATILVTGGAGFIGSHLCERLLELGNEVICVDNFDNEYSSRKKDGNIKGILKKPNFKLYKTDILDSEGLKKVFEKHKIDKIVHLAAKAGVRPSLENPELYWNVNVEGTRNVLELAKLFKVKQIVFGSSSSVYGTNEKIPFSEDDEISKMVSPYAETKRDAELLCKQYNKEAGISITCLRFFTVYGPRGRPDMAPYKFTNLIAKGKELPMYGDGSSKRDYTYVADIVDGIVKALDKELGFEIINLGNSNSIGLREFISVIETNVGKQAKIKQHPVQPGDVPVTYADISKAKSLLEWEPKTNVEEGIKRLVEWYNAR